MTAPFRKAVHRPVSIFSKRREAAASNARTSLSVV
jgi:hypothetical protein